MCLSYDTVNPLDIYQHVFYHPHIFYPFLSYTDPYNLFDSLFDSLSDSLFDSLFDNLFDRPSDNLFDDPSDNLFDNLSNVYIFIVYMDFIFYVMVIEIICGRCDVSKAIYDHDHDEISCEMTFGSHVDNL